VTSSEAPDAEPAPRARRGGRRTTGARGGAKAEDAEAPAEEPAPPPEPVAEAPADGTVAEAETSDPPSPDAQVEGGEPEERPRRRTRGSRGGARRRRETPPSPALADEEAAIQAALAKAEQPAAASDRRERGPRRDDRGAVHRRTETAAPPPQRQNGRGGGSVESLIARQNVLFEEFSQQQAQTLREMQRSMRGVGGAQAGAGNLLALPKVAVFVDVPNLIYAAEQLGVRIHFGKLLDYLTEGRQLVRATAYAPITDDPQTRFEAQRFVAPVANNGYKIVTKPWKRFADGSMKANFDIELAVDILTMSDRLDIVVLLSGDGDFRRVCELVESKGVRVEVVAFAQSVAKELRDVADNYTDLGSILNVVGA
jgi:uncharacterized LabA/DUF88 family protein